MIYYRACKCQASAPAIALAQEAHMPHKTRASCRASFAATAALETPKLHLPTAKQVPIAEPVPRSTRALRSSKPAATPQTNRTRETEIRKCRSLRQVTSELGRTHTRRQAAVSARVKKGKASSAKSKAKKWHGSAIRVVEVEEVWIHISAVTEQHVRTCLPYCCFAAMPC